jgi:hypothetical protein
MISNDSLFNTRGFLLEESPFLAALNFKLFVEKNKEDLIKTNRKLLMTS